MSLDHAARLGGEDGRLLEDERRFRELFDNAGDFIYTVDLSGNFTSINRMGERLTGYSREELLGSNIREIIAPESLEAVLRMMDYTVEGVGPAIYEVELVSKTGRRVPAEINTRPLYRDSQPAGFHGIARDISVRREADLGTRRRMAHLEALNAIIAAADASPDLPLLLEVAIDRLLGALALGSGGIWAAEHHVVRGLPQELGAAIVEAAQSGGKTATTRCSADLRAAGRGTEPISVAKKWAGIGVRSYISVPIVADGRCIGALVVASAYPRTWTLEEVTFAEAVGQQIAATAEGLRLFQETQQRTWLMERLVALSAMLNRPSSVAEAAAAIGQAALGLSGARGGAVYLWGPDATVICPWARGVTSDYSSLILSRDGAVTEDAGPNLFPDVLALPSQDPIRCAAEAEGYRGLGFWPLTYERRVVASVVCCFDTPHSWSQPEQEVFQTFVWQAASTLENARLYEAQAERAHAMEALYDLSSVLRAAQNLEDVFSRLGEHASRLLHADHAVLVLLEPDRQALSCVYTTGGPVEPDEATFPVAHTVFSQAVRTDTPYLADDMMPGPHAAEPAWLSELYRSVGPLIVVALRSNQGVVGALAIGRAKGARPFVRPEIRLLQGIAEIGGTAISRASLHHNLEEAYIQMVLSLAQAIDAKDAYTRGHSERLAALTEAVGHALGLPNDEVRDIRWAAVLHDIGKIGAPDHILFKPGPLTEQEWEIMRQHPVIGEQILLPVGRMRGVAKIVRHHQEKWDGTGYPDRLRGDAIPLGARIVAVVDAFGAMTDTRPYKHAVTPAQAQEEITRCAGTQFDPKVVDIFCRLLHRERPESRDTRTVSVAN
jgi:PAS domain S-box-containing protein/putative nucleotidyltransferase with HDIG domain